MALERAKVTELHPRAWDLAGYIPAFLVPDLSAKESFNQNYAHGGGWHPFTGFKFNPEALTITYPEDPPYKAAMKIERDNGETVLIFPHAWVLILQQDGSHEIARMD